MFVHYILVDPLPEDPNAQESGISMFPRGRRLSRALACSSRSTTRSVDIAIVY